MGDKIRSADRVAELVAERFTTVTALDIQFLVVGLVTACRTAWAGATALRSGFFSRNAISSVKEPLQPCDFANQSCGAGNCGGGSGTTGFAHV